VLAAIEGPDILIVLAVVLLLFGSTQIPKLARSLGSASREFRQAHDEAHLATVSSPAVPPESRVPPQVPVPPEAEVAGPTTGAP
jgi:sec-independent protein translocase protein TatA